MLTKQRATQQDYDKVLQIWEKSAQATHHFLSREDFIFYKVIIPQHLDSVDLLLWYDEINLVGFSGVSEDELVMLFLDPDFIGKGYGSKVLRYLIENADIKKIDVNTQNEQAKQFYISHGFRVASEDAVDGFGKPYPITHLIRID